MTFSLPIPSSIKNLISSHKSAETMAFEIEAAPVTAKRGDVVSLRGDYADYYGECVETNDATGRSYLYLFDTAFQVWRFVWVDTGRLTVLIPGGAISVNAFDAAEVQ